MYIILISRKSSANIFGCASIFSFFSILFIPLIYRCHQKSVSFSSLNASDDDDCEEPNPEFLRRSISSDEMFSKPSTSRKVIGLTLLTSSLLLNLNYLSLWMMEPLGTDGKSPASQFNITIQMVSCFFMVSSAGYYLANLLFSHKMGRKIAKLLLICYGLLICLGYWNYNVNYISMLILGFGFHQICVL